MTRVRSEFIDGIQREKEISSNKNSRYILFSYS